MITVTSALTSDLAKFYNFFRSTLHEDFPYYSQNCIRYFLKEGYSLKSITNDLKKKERWLFLASDENKIVGYLLAIRQYGGVSYCQWVVVSRKHRHQQIATRLVDLWKQTAIEDGAHKLYLTTVKDTLEFYKKLGFEVMGILPKGYYGTDNIDMYKSIAEPDEKKFLHLE